MRADRGKLLRVVAAALITTGMVGLHGGTAGGAPDSREIKAREDFAAGHYQDALDLFAKLYAETLHPIYLRNIGRCYQNLGDPDHAVTSFRDYLRKAKRLGAGERAEIDGYIAEMEALKKEREAAAKLPAQTPATERTPPPTVPAAPPAPTAPAALLTAPAQTREATDERSDPVYKRWWFWTLVVAGVAAGVGIAAASGAFTHTSDAPCLTGYICK